MMRLLVGCVLLCAGIAAMGMPNVTWKNTRFPESKLDGVGNYAMWSGRTRSRDGLRVVGSSVPLQGVVHVLAIPVSFKIDNDPTTSGNGTFPYRTWGPASQTNYLRDRLQGLSDYYVQVSGGRVTSLQYRLTGEVQLPDVLSKYASDSTGVKIMQDVVTYGDGTIDFSYADIVLLIHAGAGGEVDLLAGRKNIHSYFMALIGSTFDATIPTNDGVVIGGFCVVPETECNDDSLRILNLEADGKTPMTDAKLLAYEQNPSSFPSVRIPHYWDVVGAWAHECGHAFGLPDLYVPTQFTQGFDLGDFTLMAHGCYLPFPSEYASGIVPAYDKTRPWFSSVPCHLDAWSKQFLGWTTVVNVKNGMPNQSLLPQGNSTGYEYHLWTNGDTASKEYYLVENRATVGNDKYLPNPGVIIYHIDNSRGTLEQNSVQADARHPRVMTVPADGTLLQDSSDPKRLIYIPSADTAFPGTVKNTHFGPLTTPNSNNYQGVPTAVDISNIKLIGTMASMDLNTSTQTTITFTNPPPSSVIYITRPTLRATAMNLVPSSIQVFLNGTQYLMADTPQFDLNGLLLNGYNPATGDIAVPLDALGQLAAGTYTILLTAQDANLQVAVSNTMTFTVQEKVLPAGKLLISLPVVNVGTARKVFAGVLASDLQLWRWSPLANAYISYPKTTLVPADNFTELTNTSGTAFDRAMPTSFVPPAGKGYFLQLRTAISLRLDGDLVQHQRQYAVPLYAGFNLIGDPYIASVPFGSLQVDYNGTTYSINEAVDAQLIDPVLYGWNGSSYTIDMLPSGVLDPWAGCWVRSHVGTLAQPLNLVFSPVPNAAARKPLPQSRIAGTLQQWLVTLRATNPVNGNRATVQCGIAPGASDHVTRGKDYFAPPVMPDTLAFSSSKGDAALYRDLRPVNPTATTSWDLTLAGVPGAKVVLSWPDLSGIPAGISLTMTDLTSGDSRYLRTTPSYALTLGPQETERHFRLISVPRQNGTLQISNLTARALRLQGTVEINGVLSQDAMVSVEIRAITGRLLARIPAASHGQGALTLLWDGRGSNGSPVPRGAYQCQVTAVTRSGQSAKAVLLLSR